jgi:aquaporin Z
MRRHVAEGMGTFILVLGGIGTAVLAGSMVGAIGIALAFGLTLLVLMYTVGPVSGCHVNPAVTLGFLAARKIGPMDAVGHVVAQCAGAILAAATVWLIADSTPFGYSPSVQGLGANGYGRHSLAGFGAGGVFLTEVLLTGLLVFTVLIVVEVWAPFGFAGIAVGFALAVANLVAIPVDGTSVNPARSLGPAVFVGGWALSQLWMFIVAPLAGALLAAGAHLVLRPGVRPERAVAQPAERPIPDESLTRIAQETARLIRGRAD